MQNYTKIIGILEMKITDKHTHREVIGRHRISFGALDTILKRYKELNIPLERLKTMEPEAVEKLFYPPKGRNADIPLPDFELVYAHLHSKNDRSTLFNEWSDYKENNPFGYQYSRYCDLYKDYLEKNHRFEKLSMAVNRIPGERVYVDWTGDKPKILLDQKDGSLKKVSLFVTTVGVSSYFFVKAFEDEKISSFIDGTVSALNYYGACPKYLVPDNCKTAVIRHTRDELIINSAYEDLEKYYGFIVLPPPARKPKGKPTVEKYVQYVETSIIPKLKKHVYPSIEAINNEILSLIEELNTKTEKSEKHSKKETFEAYDLPAMNHLPQSSYTRSDYKAFETVPNNYHLEYDNHYYSIPYQYYNQSALIKASFSFISICDEHNRLIYKHRRAYNPFPKYITVAEHMPSSHRFYEEINNSNSEDFIRRAKYIGAEVTRLVTLVMRSFKHIEQSYKSVNGILHLCDGVSKVLCEEAAKKCIECGCPSYSYFKKYLNKPTLLKGEEDTLPTHDNIRGKDYYK